jgi:hypothetical protein
MITKPVEDFAFGYAKFATFWFGTIGVGATYEAEGTYGVLLIAGVFMFIFAFAVLASHISQTYTRRREGDNL